MNRRRRVFWFFFSISVFALSAVIFPNLAIFSGVKDNPLLNKAAVGPDTPYIVLGMGCFWGAEKRMQALTGVLDVEAGYAGGDAVNPDYDMLHETEMAIRQGRAIKNHAEVVKVYFDPAQTDLEQVLIEFWESHNPTQGNRQGNDIGSNYRSAVYYRSDEERRLAEKTRAVYQTNLVSAGISEPITTEIAPLKNYTSAESDHQDYLKKNPLGYCGLGGMGVAYVDSELGERHGTPVAADPGYEENWEQKTLNAKEQLIAFEAVDCAYCRQFDKEVLATWEHAIPIVSTNSRTPPQGWQTDKPLFATPTIVLFRDRQEVARYTGYQGAEKFWQWLKTSSNY